MRTQRDWFWLYRPRAASHRAQAIQVVCAAHAMARRGHRVTLCVQGDGDPLAFCGLEPVPTLILHHLPARSAPASWAYQARFARWLRRAGPDGVVLARSKRHAVRALRWARGRFRLVLEAHEVDSLQAQERGVDPGVHLAREARCLMRSWALVCNCEGTLELLRSVHGVLPPARVVHNGTHAVWPEPGSDGEGIGYVGSVRADKDLECLARAAAGLDETVVLVGPTAAQIAPLQRLAGGRLEHRAPWPYGQVPARLGRFRALVVTEGQGLFGRRLTSPLKLWDALASGVPVVAADTPAVRAVAGQAFVPYRPGDPDDLRHALRRACRDPALRAAARAGRRVRTWADRAAELDAFVAGVLP